MESQLELRNPQFHKQIKQKQMSNLRDKYKPTSTKQLKSKIQEEDALVGSSDRAGYLSIDEGTNKFRIYPAHNPDSGDWYVLVLKHWITVEGDDGKERRTTVLNAKHHGGFKKDPFEEYITMAKKHLTENEDDDAATKIANLTDWKVGLTSSASWLLYADKVSKENKEFGLLEFNKSTRDGLNKIACFEEEDEAIQTEPFTDPDEGIPVLITYNSKAKKAGDKYSVTSGTKPKAMPLSDEDLENFDGQKPLNEMYKNYGIDDLAKALEGIKNFDEKQEIGLCDTDEWQEKIEELKNMVKGGSKKTVAPTKPSSPAKPLAKKPVKVEEEEEEIEEEEQEEAPKPTKKSGDKFHTMDRDELKIFWAENELSQFGDKLMKSDSDDDIRKKVRDAYYKLQEEAKSSQEEEEEEEEEEAPKPVAKKTIQVAKKPIAKQEEEEEDDDESLSLEAIKAKIKKDKG